MSVLYIFLLSLIISVMSCHSSTSSNSSFTLTKSRIQNTEKSNTSQREILKQETIYGCVQVPQEVTWRNMWVRAKFTGEICSATIGPGNTVSVSFVEEGFVTVKQINDKDILIGSLQNDQVLVAQYFPNGQLISVTQTVYNKNNQLVYGNVEGEFIKECIFNREENRRHNKNRSCP